MGNPVAVPGIITEIPEEWKHLDDAWFTSYNHADESYIFRRICDNPALFIQRLRPAKFRSTQSYSSGCDGIYRK
jgi:hypothetical protein